MYYLDHPAIRALGSVLSNILRYNDEDLCDMGFINYCPPPQPIPSYPTNNFTTILAVSAITSTATFLGYSLPKYLNSREDQPVEVETPSVMPHRNTQSR